MNKFIGIGRNTKDGELRTTENGINVYINTLAITNNFKNKDGNYDSEFINYIAYRSTAEYLNKYATKGSMIAIEGRIHTRSYEDKDKNKKYATEVIVENASVLDKRKETQETTQSETQTIEEAKALENYNTEYQDNEIQLTNSDLPF